MLSSTARRVHATVGRSRFSKSISKAAATATTTTQGTRLTARSVLPVALFFVGVAAGRLSFRTPEEDERIKQLPLGYPLDCCGDHAGVTKTTCDDQPLTTEQQEVVSTLKRIVGKNNMWDGREENSVTTQYLKGARLGYGPALAIVRPYKLTQIQDIVVAAADAGCAVLVQGSNTGLTGGSIPRKTSDGRPTILISMKNFDSIIPIDNGEKVLTLAGAGLGTLRNYVDEKLGRESHCVLGSTFLNPTTAAGVAFGSGGSQMRKGPAWTERALYLKVVADKYGKHTVKVVNTLGIEGLDSEEGEFTSHKGLNGVIPQLDKYVEAVKHEQPDEMKKSNKTHGKQPSHDHTYKENLCTIDNGISRFNADTKGIDCNRSEGKVIILATVHTTFYSPPNAKCMWLSFSDMDTTNKFKTQVCLNNPADMPKSCEYIGRDSFDVIDRAGRVAGHVINFFGLSSPYVSKIWDLKKRFEGIDIRGAATLPDKFNYLVNPIVPPLLPKPIMDMGRRHDHNILTVIGDFEGSLNRFEERFAKFCEENKGKVEHYECQTQSETNAAVVFRFCAAPAFKTFVVGTGLQGVSVDYALPKNCSDIPVLPPSNQPVKRMRHSHFGCNVIHESLAYEMGVDTHKAKMELKHVVDEVYGGKLPAEHGHGTEYIAPKDTQKRWQKMDPMNVMNPGVGGLSTRYKYESEAKPMT